jgi:LPXTG-motif cell wall-anchored protein
VINIQRDVLYVRQPVKLSLAELLRLAGVSITDAEESLDLDALDVAGYDSINWTAANYPSGAGYTITISLKDTAGAEAPVRQIALFIAKSDVPVTPISPDDPRYPDLPTPPPGYQWGEDEEGNLILYPIPSSNNGDGSGGGSGSGSGTSGSGSGSGSGYNGKGGSIPKTGDSLSLATALSTGTLGLAGALLFALKRRKKKEDEK